MEPLLQPLRTAQLLDRAVHLFRRHFIFFVLLCLPAVVFVVGTGELIRRAFSGLSKDGSAEVFFGWIFQILAYSIAFGATAAPVVFAMRAIETNQPYSVVECYRAVRKHWLRIMGIVGLIGVRIIGAYFAGSIVPIVSIRLLLRHYPAFFANFYMWRIAISVAALVLIIGSMFWMIHVFARHSFAVACCAVENTGVRASLKRSRKLSKDAKRRIWTMFFFAACLFTAIASAAELPAALAPEWTTNNKLLFGTWTLLGSTLAMGISSPIVVIGTVLIYYDQRVRREAFDVETLIAATEAANAVHVEEKPVSVDAPSLQTLPVEEAEPASAEKADESPDAFAATSGS